MLDDDLSGEQGQVLSLRTPAPVPHTCDGGLLPNGISPLDLVVVRPESRKERKRARRQRQADMSGITLAQQRAHEDYGG